MFCTITVGCSLEDGAVLVVVGEVHAQLLLHARCRDLEHPRGRVVAVPDGRHTVHGREVLNQELGVGSERAGCTRKGQLLSGTPENTDR